MKPTVTWIALALPISVSLRAVAQTKRGSESCDSTTQAVSAGPHLLITSGDSGLGGAVGLTALGRYDWRTPA